MHFTVCFFKPLRGPTSPEESFGSLKAPVGFTAPQLESFEVSLPMLLLPLHRMMTPGACRASQLSQECIAAVSVIVVTLPNNAFYVVNSTIHVKPTSSRSDVAMIAT